MSINKIFITTAIAALGVSSVTTAANAQNARYGGADVHTYESGTNCNVNPCAPVAAPAKSSRYGGHAQQMPAYNDCAPMNACGPQVMAQPTTVYTQPAAPVYTQPQYTQQTTQYVQQAQMAPANCPAGTTAQNDGTCLQGSSYSATTTSTYSAGSSITLPETHDSSAVYGGDATTTSYGYTSDGAYTATDYQPIRK